MWEYDLPLGGPGEITCSEEGANHDAAPFLVIAYLPAPKRHGVLRHNNQSGKNGKGG